MKQITYTIHEATTVKSFLLEMNYSKKSMSAIKRNGAFIINDSTVTVRGRLNPGDMLTVQLPAEQRSMNLIPFHTSLNILYNDEFIIIVEKPPFISTIPSRLHPHHSLIEAVYGLLIELGDCSVLHPVSRLDRNTSGLIVFAKHQLIHHLLTQKIEKQYLLLCSGHINAKGNICMPIDRTADSIITREVSISGQEARTEYQLVNYYSEHDCSLVKVKLHTGRTHQIRVHFQAIGHPLLGDTLYGNDTRFARQALHAYRISFEHPINRKMIDLENPLSKDLSKIFDMI
ncbi:RluA family pseudouridine synthase [Macrococcus equi]|uniref:RluA family pseudouridine synthase n=1 Tax=Macrococcus equi TaxID=3395462 RepID=UPI0039BDB9FE